MLKSNGLFLFHLPRLLAALIKHSANTQVMHCIIEHGGMSRLVAMAMSEHTLMQNEALIALTLLSSTQLGK